MNVFDRLRAAIPKRAPKAPRPPGHPATWLIQITAAVVLAAATTEWVWAVLFCVEATGHVLWHVDWANGSDGARTWEWALAFAANLPVLFALVLATVPIVLWSMIWLPMWQQARGTGRARRITMAAAGILANALVILSGTIVMNGNRQDQVREQLVVEQSAAQSRAQMDAEIAAIETRLREMRNHENQYMAVAATVGAAAFERDYLSPDALAGESAARVNLLRRSLGAARVADGLEADLTRLRGERALAAPEAASVAVVEDHYGAGMNAFAQYAQVYRPPFVALICTLIGIWGAWWLVGVWERDLLRRQAEQNEPDEARLIPDLRAEPAPEPQPMDPPREVVRDADTGEELVRVRPKPYWRRKKGQKQDVTIAPDPLPDDVGFPDAARSALSAEELMASGAMAAEADAAREPVQEPAAEAAEDQSAEAEHAPVSEEEAALWDALAAEPEPEPETELPNKEGVMVTRETEDA